MPPEPTTEELAGENRLFRRTLGDMVALSTLPAVWGGRQPREIAESLADVLRDSLDLDLVYIYSGESADIIEIARCADWPSADQQPGLLGSELAPYLKSPSRGSIASIPDLWGSGTHRVVISSIGCLNSEPGFLAAGSRLPGFPTEPDRLLIMFVANQAAIAIDNARLYQAARELEKTALRRADELAEADRRKNEFLATLAHELRNPLASIRTAARVLKLQDAIGPVVLRQREIIERQTLNMGRLLEDLLDVSRITRGLSDLKKELLDFAEIIRVCVEGYAAQLEARSLSLSLSLPPEPLWVEADRVRLEQVASNLLGNAAKYTEPGGHIRVVVSQNDPDAVLQVLDNGRGIDPDLLPQVFDLFTQGDRNLDRSEGGLGIGLTMVKNLVEMHGGSVGAKSAGPGAGAEFTVRLPLIGVAQKNLAKTARPTALASLSPHGSHRILIVDDNRDGANSLSDLLTLWGYDALLAYDGPSALEKARIYRPRAILLDIGMPGMDGYEVARKLRGEAGGSARTLIALTGYGREKDRDQASDAGFDHHLTKPVDPDQLQRLLHSLFDTGADQEV